MGSNEIRQKYLEFFKSRGHAVIPSAPIVPLNDPTTLFTSCGMQPLIPYLLGQPHPSGKRLTNSQKSFRSQDIDEVGDRSHTTFFEMLGNWSLGDYFKQEQLPWFFEFLTKELGLDQNRLFVTVFEGDKAVPRDDESFGIWKKLGIPESRVFFYGVKKNWWSRSGEPASMPAGEPGGPDSEVFYDFGEDLKLHENSLYKNEACHPNCQCGRFMEIGNSVFMQYQKNADGILSELPQKNVDFGGGLERLNAAVNHTPDIFTTDSFRSIIQIIETLVKKKYGTDLEFDRSVRIIADHLRAAVMMMSEGVIPSNKTQGYMLRRLIRRSILFGKKLNLWGDWKYLDDVVSVVGKQYEDVNVSSIQILLKDEASRFSRTVEKGLREIAKIAVIDGKQAFFVYESYGFPWELTEEIARELGQQVDRTQFEIEFKKHQELSRSSAKGMFKGGLVDQSEQTTKLHTAHHLLLASLQKIVDPSIRQRGSNITGERLRIDFNFSRKLTPDELKKIEELINEKIQENLPVVRMEMNKTEAEKLGAQMEFGAKYPDRVSVYFIGSTDHFFSTEFCGGPHVSFTAAIGHLTIKKEESAGAGVHRIYAGLA